MVPYTAKRSCHLTVKTTPGSVSDSQRGAAPWRMRTRSGESLTIGRGEAHLDQARLRTNDGYARISHVAWRLMRRRVAVQMVILATVVLTCSAAHALTPTDGIQGVYSAQDRQSETSLYAILQQLPPPPGDMPAPPAWRNGVLLRVLVTAQGLRVWRLRPGGSPVMCPVGNARHSTSSSFHRNSR